MENGQRHLAMMNLASYFHITKLTQFTALGQRVSQCVTKYMTKTLIIYEYGLGPL